MYIYDHSAWLNTKVVWNRLDENTRKITNYESFKDTLMANTIDKSFILCRLKAGANNYGKIKNGR